MPPSQQQLQNFFTQNLLEWHTEHNDRNLPWKNERDPYKIWLSEIILQQTRALQGLPYYLKFISEFPTIKNLAHADEGYVYKIWEGLGYYNRCRNMLATARYIADDLGGIFPNTHESILQLKGIGTYTAAAIASFAFDLPHAVVDGNVYRVLSRFFGIDTPYDTTTGKKEFALLAQNLLPEYNSAGYNQAIMDLGATVCAPKNTKCAICPLHQNCFAYRKQLVNVLPVRSKTLQIKTRYFTYLLLQDGDNIWVQQRKDNDIWQGLYELYLIEDDHALTLSELQENKQFKDAVFDCNTILFSGKYKQKLTHRIIETRFYTLELKSNNTSKLLNGIWININEINNFAFPKTILMFLKEKVYF